MWFLTPEMAGVVEGGIAAAQTADRRYRECKRCSVTWYGSSDEAPDAVNGVRCWCCGEMPV